MDDLASMIGVMPNMQQLLLRNTQLGIKCILGPLKACQYRMVGEHKWDEAENVIGLRTFACAYKEIFYAFIAIAIAILWLW